MDGHDCCNDTHECRDMWKEQAESLAEQLAQLRRDYKKVVARANKAETDKYRGVAGL